MRAASSFFVEECMLFLVRGKHNIKACLDKKYQNSNAFIVICIHMKYWSVRETKDFFFFYKTPSAAKQLSHWKDAGGFILEQSGCDENQICHLHFNLHLHLHFVVMPAYLRATTVFLETSFLYCLVCLATKSIATSEALSPHNTVLCFLFQFPCS